MNLQAINLRQKFTKFSEHWSPKIIAEMNDHQFKLVKFQGEFVGIRMTIRMRFSWCSMAP